MNEQFKIYNKQEPTYEEAKEFIGGYIQSVPLENGDRLLCDEEGKLKGLPLNPHAQKHWDESWGQGTDVIVGKAILVKGEVNQGW
jgi:hypothetical protein